MSGIGMFTATGGGVPTDNPTRSTTSANISMPTGSINGVPSLVYNWETARWIREPSYNNHTDLDPLLLELRRIRIAMQVLSGLSDLDASYPSA